jgi:hypothetical protein
MPNITGSWIGSAAGTNYTSFLAELCEIVDETIELYKKDGKPLPPATSGKDYANKMLNVA